MVGALGRPENGYRFRRPAHMSLRLQRVFGLWREGSIKFQSAYADRGDHIALKACWCKAGGNGRF